MTKAAATTPVCPSCKAQGRAPTTIRTIRYNGVDYHQCMTCKFWSTNKEAWDDVS